MEVVLDSKGNRIVSLVPQWGWGVHAN
jgi:hypothetical protein